MPQFSSVQKYIPLIIGLILLAIIALIAPWGQIGKLLANIPFSTFIVLTLLSFVYYASKTIRFWYILRLLSIKKPFLPVALLYLSGQPFSILPAGELYRTVLLKRHLGVSITKSSPSVTIQGIVEAIVLLFISLVGAFFIGQNQFIIGFVGLFLILMIVTLRNGWLSKMHVIINKIPYLSVDQTKFQKFVASHQQLMKPKTLTTLVLFSMIPVASGIGILYVSSQAIGFDIKIIESAIGYSLPVIISGLSFLPGGLGVSEGGTIGMVQLFGASAAAAVTIALLVRIFTLVSGLLYGVIAQTIVHMKKGSL